MNSFKDFDNTFVSVNNLYVCHLVIIYLEYTKYNVLP